MANLEPEIMCIIKLIYSPNITNVLLPVYKYEENRQPDISPLLLLSVRILRHTGTLWNRKDINSYLDVVMNS